MRSAVFATIVLALAGAAHAAPVEPGRIEFDVLRNGQPFGRHTVSVTGAQGNLRAENRVTLRAGVGPVTVFRYEQNCTETWRSGALAGLECSTLKDGRRTQVSAQIQGQRLRVTGAGSEHFFPVGAFPTSWWTRPPTDAETFLDTETGAPMRVRVSRVGRETIEVGGQRIEAERLRVQGSIIVDLWYDLNGRWVGCTFTARGQTISYRLTTPIDSAPS